MFVFIDLKQNREPILNCYVQSDRYQTIFLNFSIRLHLIEQHESANCLLSHEYKKTITTRLYPVHNDIYPAEPSGALKRLRQETNQLICDFFTVLH